MNNLLGKMSKNTKKIIFMAGAVVVMAVVLLLVMLPGSQEELIISDSDITSGSEQHTHMVQNTDGVLFINRESDELESIKLTNRNGVYDISRSPTEGELQIAQLKDVPVNTGFIELVWYNTLSLGYSYSIVPHEGEQLNLADYGLDDPQVIIEGKYYDGTRTRVCVGNGLTGGDEIYYYTIDGHDGVYITEFNLAFFQGDSYWVSDDVFGDSGLAEIDDIKLSGSAFTEKTQIIQNSPADKSDPYYDYDFIIKQGGRTFPADDYKLSLLIDELCELTADEAVCVYPASGQLAQYGLDKPSVIIEHTRDGAKKTVRIARKDALTFYLKADGVDVVYEFAAESYGTLVSATVDYLRSADVHVRYFQTVASIKVEADGETYDFRIERVPLSTDETLYEYYAYCGDKQLSLEYYKNLLEVFNTAAASSFDSADKRGEKVMTVTITHHSEFARGTEVLEYYSVGTRRYLCTVNGEETAIVTSMWLDKFISDAQKLSQGEVVIP